MSDWRTIDKGGEEIEKATKFVEELESRDLIYQVTDKSRLIEALANGKKVYFGIDPTSDFLHLGHYLGIVLIRRFLDAGYKAVILIGEMTAQIGDPSFRERKRGNRAFDSVLSHASEIHDQIIYGLGNGLLKDGFSKRNLEVVNNYELWDKHYRVILNKEKLRRMDYFDVNRDSIAESKWLSISESMNKGVDVGNSKGISKEVVYRIIDEKRKMSEFSFIVISFLRDFCSKWNVNHLLNREFLKDRFKNGLTIDELIYPTLQAWDFWFLFTNHDVFIQIGGSDQWGNIASGLSFVNDDRAVGFTFPLLVDSSGKKFGKSEGNAIPITGRNFSLFDVYQYLFNSKDSDVFEFAKKLSLRPLSEIEELRKLDIQEAKRRLAILICSDISGNNPEIVSVLEDGVEKLFDSPDTIDWRKAKAISAIIPRKTFKNTPIVDVFLDLNLISSKSEFRRLVKEDGLQILFWKKSLDNPGEFLKAEDSDRYDDVNKSGFFVLRRGKKKFGIAFV